MLPNITEKQVIDHYSLIIYDCMNEKMVATEQDNHVSEKLTVTKFRWLCLHYPNLYTYANVSSDK